LKYKSNIKNNNRNNKNSKNNAKNNLKINTNNNAKYKSTNSNNVKVNAKVDKIAVKAKTKNNISEKIKNIDIKKAMRSILFFPISIFYLELIFRFFGLKKGVDISIIYLLLYSSMLGLTAYIVSTFFDEKYNKIISKLFMFLLCFTVCVQFVYYKLFYTPMILYSLSGAGQVAEFSDMVIEAIIKNFFVILMLFVPFLVLFFKKSRQITFNKIVINKKMMIASSVMLLNIVMFSVLAIGGTDINSDYDIYYGENVPELLINKFGILKLIQKDLGTVVFANPSGEKVSDLDKYIDDVDEKDNKDDIINFIDDKDDNSNNDNGDEKNPLDDDTNNSYSKILKALEKHGIQAVFNRKDLAVIGNIAGSFGKEPNIMAIDFDKLIENETDKNIITMHKYFSSVEPTVKNMYTGIFKDYNLILITAEGFSHLAIDKDLTPTLYKMANESFVFNNFYTPIWGVSTSDGEYVACQGLIPKSGLWSFYRSGNNYLPFVMGNQFKSLGYETRAYHNHYYDFYSRDVSHPNMGYDYKGVGNGLEIKDTWPESDLEMIEVTVPEYINDEKFHTYYMTVSGHKNYTFYGNYISKKNKELVDHLDASEAVKAYYACNIELDKAMELLLKQLEEKGILDKTVIAISADHYPYGLEKQEIDEIAGHKVEENFELYKNAFILWANGRETVVVDRPCSSLDINPTLSNMFGLEYDSRLLMGRDMFSNSSPLVIFANRSFITDKVMYNSKTKEVINLTNEELEAEYIKDINKIISAKFAFSAQILDRDYYKHVFKPD
jgi:hypothetical protein